MDIIIYLKKTNVPPKHIMVSRTSTKITMRLLILDQLQNIKTGETFQKYHCLERSQDQE